MAIHQLVHTLNYGDAISSEALTLRALFRRRGIESEVFTVHAHEKVREYCISWEAGSSRIAAGDAIILHHSIASPLNRFFLSLSGQVRYFLYHNVTPDHWFRRCNARVVRDLVEARGELPQFVRSGARLMADSSYNREELEAVGGKDVDLLPLPFDEEKWRVPANPGIGRILRRGVNFLHVGRVAPNKRIEDVIKAFYFYHHKINPESRLWLVGSDVDTELYSFELRQLTGELRLNHAVNFVGAVADAELRAFYENADAYLCMSEHEGFCVPLLEAMYFGVPIIAFASCAVPETVGEAGVLIREKDPALTAEVMNILVADLGCRDRFRAAGRNRVQQFSLAAFERRVEEIFLDAVSAGHAQGWN